ncbi:HTH domain-containing protein [Lactococcus lactis]|uniref:HTH domain-containing protein n=1 Tax=Lactococcus lactis TaxID=1358 RepID=UPI0028807286|nr:HTH domain-containing protein [Lactococcus lactis]
MIKKAERIQQELFFLNGKSQFKLKEIMDEFNISKRTALRDIQELERLGLPILFFANTKFVKGASIWKVT